MLEVEFTKHRSKSGISEENFNYKKDVLFIKTRRKISGNYGVLYAFLPLFVLLMVVTFARIESGEVKNYFIAIELGKYCFHMTNSAWASLSTGSCPFMLQLCSTCSLAAYLRALFHFRGGQNLSFICIYPVL